MNHDEFHLTAAELEAGLDHILQSPKDAGELALIVRRPAENEREVLDEGQLDLVKGLVGDTWCMRGSSRMPDHSPHPDMQLNLINARVIGLLAREKERWPLAGDQLYLDLDLSAENLPPGTRLQIGTAIIAITDQPHTGCSKFMARFGQEALKFISNPTGKRYNMRGVNAKVMQPGTIRTGDIIKKV
jgi:hypothetical protein